MRDLLIGAVPPYSFVHRPYMAITVTAVFAIRVVALRRTWSAPTPRAPDAVPEQNRAAAPDDAVGPDGVPAS